DDVSIDSGVLAQQPDVGRRMISAARRAPRPMHRQPLTGWHARFEMTRGLERELFGFNEREMAVIDAGAAHETADHAGRIVAELPQQRLRDERPEPLVR